MPAGNVWGSAGVYGSAAVLGLTDVEALTLSMAVGESLTSSRKGRWSSRTGGFRARADCRFNTDALRAAAAAGNTPRNFLRGSAQKRVDLSIAKTVHFGSRVRAELRWEIFNVFNTVNFGAGKQLRPLGCRTSVCGSSPDPLCSGTGTRATVASSN